MAFPKRRTRKIVVGGTTYLWHLSQNSLECKNTLITIAQANAPNQILHIDPFPALLGSFEIMPRTVRRVILWALKQGWQPARKLPPMYVGYRDKDFFILPRGKAFTHDVDKENDE